MPKVYSAKEIADIFRQTNPGSELDRLSDAEVLTRLPTIPGGNEWLARLAPPPLTKAQTMKDLAARAFKAVTPALTKLRKPEPEVGPQQSPIKYGVAAAARAAKGMMISGPGKPPPSDYDQFMNDELEIKPPPIKPGFISQAAEAARSATKNVFANPVQTWLKTTDISKTEDPFAGMKELGAAARMKGVEGAQLPPEQEKALEDFTKSNFEALVVYPAIISTAVLPVMRWYIANRTLPGAVKAAGKAVEDALVKEGFDRPTAARVAGQGMTNAAAKAEAAGMKPPGIPEFVAVRKAAEKGIKPKTGMPNAPAEAGPGVKPGAGAAPTPAAAAPVDIKAIKQQVAEIRAGMPAEVSAPRPVPPAGIPEAASLAGFTDKEGRVFVRLTKVPGETLAPWSWEYKGPAGEPYRGNASTKELALATIKKKFINPPAAPPPPAIPEPAAMPPDTSKIWNMPLEKLQEKIVNEKMEAPTWMDPAQVAADRKAYPDGEYMRKWAAVEAMYNNPSRHGVPPEIIKKFKLESEAAWMKDVEKQQQGEINQSLLDARGGATPFWDLAKEMKFFSKKKTEMYLGAKTGKDWRGKEIPDELAWLIRPSGKAGWGEFAHTAFVRGLTPENDITLAIEGLTMDRELKKALEAGEDISKILNTGRDMPPGGGVHGAGYLAKRRPPVDLAGQQFIPGAQPAMDPNKIRKEVFVDQAEFDAAFTAAPDEPGLFDAIKEVEKAAVEVKKTPWPNKKVIITKPENVAFGIKTDWGVKRLVDNRSEASGFKSKQEAIEWAKKYGWEVVDRVPGGQAAMEAPPLDQPAANFQPIITDKEFKLWRSTEMLILKYAKRFGEDRVVIPRGAVGIFYPNTKNIFLQAANNVYVTLHEVVHYISNKTDWAKIVMRTVGTTKNGQPIYDPQTLWIRKLLTQFYVETYPGASSTHPLKKRVEEGMAMLGQKAAETPEMLKDPTWIPLQRAILEPGGRYYQKDFAAAVADCRAIMDKYRSLSALEQGKARLLGAGGRVSGAESLFTAWNKIEEIFFNQYAKFAKMDELTGNKYGLAAAVQGYKYWSSWANANTKPDAGLRVLLNRGFVKLGDNNLGQLFKQIDTAGNADNMDAWLIMRRVRAGYQAIEAIRQKLLGLTEGNYDIKAPGTGALQKWLKVKETELEPQDYGLLIFSIKSNVKEYGLLSARAAKDNIGKDLANRAYAEGMRDFPAGVWAAIYNDISRAIITMEEDVGRLSHELADRYRADPAYASFRHDIMGMRQDTEVGQGATTAIKSSFTKEWKGSEKPFVGPLMGLVQNFFESARKTSITRLNNTMYRAVDENPELFGATVIKEDLISVPDGKGGFDHPQLRDPAIVMARADGKFKPLRILDKSLMGIIRVSLLDPKVADVFETVVRRFSVTFTRGTTAWFGPFFLKNLPRDFFAGFIQSSTKMKPFIDQAKTFRELIREEGGPRADAWRDYEMLTGGQQTLAKIYSAADSPEEAYRWLTHDTTKTQKLLKGAEVLGDVLSKPAEFSEKLMRGQEYVNSIRDGDSVLVALEKASKVTAAFPHMGTWGGKHGQTAVKAGAFINPAFQVLAQFIETLKDPSKRRRLLGAVIALTAAAVGGSMAIRTASPRQKQNYRGLQPGMFSGNIIFPAWGKVAREKGRLITIAVPNDYAVAANLINMIVQEYLLGDNKFDGDEYMQAGTAWIPDQMNFTQIDRMMFSWMPVMIGPYLQMRMGRKVFPKVMPLMPGEVADLPREKRITENTSWLAKSTANNIGKALDLSPIEVDFLIEGYLGRVSRFVTWRTGTGIFTNPIYTDLYLNAMRDTETFYKIKQTIAEQEKYFKEQQKIAGAALAAPLEMDTKAESERAAAAAQATGDISKGPSKELLALAEFKPAIANIDDEVRKYRFWSRVKNPGPAAMAERDKWRDMILLDMNLLNQAFKKRP